MVPVTMVMAMLAFAVAAATAGMVPYRPMVWPAAVELAILGGITPMIYAVNIRIVPVFARRTWPGERWLHLQVALAVTGAWAVYAGHLTGNGMVVTVGNSLALASALLFSANVVRLFRQPAAGPPPPLLHLAQATVDRLATGFTRLSGTYLLVGLGVSLATSLWRPSFGRWDLVWVHAMLVGFFLSMASGVSYHVLTRWTGRPWRSVASIRFHLLAVTAGLPLMLLALATDQAMLFAIAGPLQVAALALYLVNIAPMVPALPGPTRPAFGAAAVLLAIGIGLAAAFAIEPGLGARLRLVHAELNLFGWTGLLISGVAYYLVPRFAGRPLRWTRLAALQLTALAAGVVLGAAALLWRSQGVGPAALVVIAQGMVAVGFLLLGATIAGTFRGRAGVAIALQPRVRPAAVHLPMVVITVPCAPAQGTSKKQRKAHTSPQPGKLAKA